MFLFSYDQRSCTYHTNSGNIKTSKLSLKKSGDDIVSLRGTGFHSQGGVGKATIHVVVNNSSFNKKVHVFSNRVVGIDIADDKRSFTVVVEGPTALSNYRIEWDKQVLESDIIEPGINSGAFFKSNGKSISHWLIKPSESFSGEELKQQLLFGRSKNKKGHTLFLKGKILNGEGKSVASITKSNKGFAIKTFVPIDDISLFLEQKDGAILPTPISQDIFIPGDPNVNFRLFATIFGRKIELKGSDIAGSSVIKLRQGGDKNILIQQLTQDSGAAALSASVNKVGHGLLVVGINQSDADRSGDIKIDSGEGLITNPISILVSKLGLSSVAERARLTSVGVIDMGKYRARWTIEAKEGFKQAILPFTISGGHFVSDLALPIGATVNQVEVIDQSGNQKALLLGSSAIKNVRVQLDMPEFGHNLKQVLLHADVMGLPVTLVKSARCQWEVSPKFGIFNTSMTPIIRKGESMRCQGLLNLKVKKSDLGKRPPVRVRVVVEQ